MYINSLPLPTLRIVSSLISNSIVSAAMYREYYLAILPIWSGLRLNRVQIADKSTHLLTVVLSVIWLGLTNSECFVWCEIVPDFKAAFRRHRYPHPAAICSAKSALDAFFDSSGSSPTSRMNFPQLIESIVLSTTACKAGTSGADDFLVCLILGDFRGSILVV